MLSIDGFRHHLGMIEHETNMYHVYKHQVSLDTVERSKQVLLDNFLEQQKEIQKLNRLVKQLENHIRLRKGEING